MTESPLSGNRMKFIIRLLIITAAAFFLSCKDNQESKILSEVFENSSSRYALVISKKDFKLTVYDRAMNSAAVYRIGYGSSPDMLAKLYEGDNRTPEGIYFINEILSMDASTHTEAYRKLQRMNQVYFRSSSGYHKFGNPGVDLGDNAYGPRFFGIDYPNNKDRERYKKALEEENIPSVKGKPAGIGYGIAIHGNNDENSVGNISSSGCIRMFNRDIVELDRYIDMGTPVIITGR